MQSLTHGALERLSASPPPNRVELKDRMVPSLVARVTPNGVVTLSWYRWYGGRPRRHVIGRWPECSIEAARIAARKKDADLAAGLSIIPTQGGVSGRTLLSEIWDSYLEHAKAHRKRPDDAKSRWKHLKSFKDLPLGSITRGAIERWHRALGQSTGQIAANRCLALLSALFNNAKRHGFSGENPCHLVTHFREMPRTRVLQGHELKRLLEVLANEQDTDLTDFIRLGIATGARRGNLASMKWGDLDLLAQVWSISGAEAKNGRPLILPLGADALAILERRHLIRRESSSYVFPARRSEPKFPYQTSWQPRVRRVFDAAGLSDLRFHDLRRTFGTYSLNAGTDLALVSALLGHRQLATTAAVYAHATTVTLRGVVNRTTQHLLTAAARAAENAESQMVELEERS